MLRNNKNILIAAFVLLAVLLTAYSNHFNNGFHFDDSHAVVDNVHIRNIKNITTFFSDPRMFSADPTHWGLRPLVTTTLAIDYWLGGGLKPFYFQLSTFIVYAFLCVLLFFMYKNLVTQSIHHPWAIYIAFVATAWFTLHTANAETVNYIIARSDVLSTFCIVASFLIYLSYPKKRKLYLYIVPAFIGVFAKETVLVLVILMFFYILLFEKELSISDLFKPRNFKLVLNTVVKLLPLTIVVIATQVYALSKISSVPGITNPFAYYILTQSYVWLHYFIAFFLPLNLSADTDWSVIRNVFDERIIIGLSFVAALVVVIIKTSAKTETKPIAFGFIWFAASLLPTSLAPFAEVTNDHRMFFAFIGLALSVVTYIGLWLVKVEKDILSNLIYRVIIATAIVLVLGLNAYGVYQRNKVWKNEESLWYDVTLKSPLNGRGLMNYGLTQMEKGNYDVANAYFNKAAAYLPYYSTLFINIGILNGATGKPADAEAAFKKAIALSPDTFDVYAFYARWLLSVNRVGEAAQMAETAIRINPYSTISLNVLMATYNTLGLWDNLAQTAKQVLAISPYDTTATAFLKASKDKAPIALVNTINNNKPLTAGDYLNLSQEYYNKQDYLKCIEACQDALKLNPNCADAYSNMGAAYNQLKKWSKGEEACEKALKINPNHQLAKGNLAWAKSHIGS